MKRTELTYSERLIIRKALERVYTPAGLRAFLSEMSTEEKQEAERLERLFKEYKIEIVEED